MSSTNTVDDIAPKNVAPVDIPFSFSGSAPAKNLDTEPVIQPSKKAEPYDAALKEIGEKLKEQGLDQNEIDMHLENISLNAKKNGITDARELMSSYMKDSNYKIGSDDFKGNFEKIFDSFVAGKPEKTTENGDPQNSVDQLISQAQLQPKMQASEGNAQQIPPQKEQTQMMRSSVVGDFARGFGSMVKSIIDRKNEGPGKSFTDLQQGGNGLGMNNPNLDPNLLANTSLDRLDQSVKALSGLRNTADPAVIERAKAGVMDAATDAQKYMGNENRSLLANMAEGKINQFDAADKMEDRSKRFESAMNKASTAEVSVEDEDFNKKLKEATEKAMEAIKQMMESIREMASKLLGMGNDEPAKKTGPSAGPR